MGLNQRGEGSHGSSAATLTSTIHDVIDPNVQHPFSHGKKSNSRLVVESN
jgi:hypothetical protein